MRSIVTWIAIVVVTMACVRYVDPIGSTSSRVINEDDLQQVGVFSYGAAAAYVPHALVDPAAPPLDEQIVVTYDRSKYIPSLVHDAPGWSVLSCAGGLDCASGPTFIQTCAFDDATCNGGTIVPHIAGQTAWLGRSSVAAEGVARSVDGGGVRRNVVIATLVDTNSDVNRAEAVALLVSNDGGVTFTKTLALPEMALADDFPSVTFDNTVDPPLGVVVWRVVTSTDFGQLGSFGGWIQRFFINSNGDPELIDAPGHFVDNMDRAGGGANEGQGYLKVLAADGVITVVYSNDDSMNNHVCGQSGGHDPTDISWGAVNTFDGGEHWSQHTHIVETHDFVWCANNDTIQRGLKEYDAALGPDGNLYFVASTAEGEVRLFMSTFRGAPVRDANLFNDSSWREWCPFGQSGPTPGRWLQVSQPCPDAAFKASSIIRPTLGFDTDARLLVGFYESVDQPPLQNALQFTVRSVTTPRAALSGTSDLQPERSTDVAFSPNALAPIGYGPNPPVATPPANGLTALGLGWQTAIVAGGAMMPFPQGTRRYFPFWTQPTTDPSGASLAVETTRVEFTPAP